jgi:hypothetical protein
MTHVIDDEKLSLEQMAATEFSPWTDRSVALPSVDQWMRLRQRLGIAFGIMFKSKPEIVAAIAQIGAESAQGSMKELDEAADLLSALQQIADGASTRLLIALATVAVEDEEHQS